MPSLRIRRAFGPVTGRRDRALRRAAQGKVNRRRYVALIDLRRRQVARHG